MVRLPTIKSITMSESSHSVIPLVDQTINKTNTLVTVLSGDSVSSVDYTERAGRGGGSSFVTFSPVKTI